MDGLEDQLDSLTDLQQDLAPSSFYDYDEEEIDPTQPINDLLVNSVEVDIYKTESEINKLESEIENR